MPHSQALAGYEAITCTTCTRACLIIIIQGAKVNAVDTTRGLPVLIQAASNGHLEAMNALIEHGADLNSQTKR